MKKSKYDWKNSPRWLNLLMGLNQFGNTLLRFFDGITPDWLIWPGVGNPDRTISFTLGALQEECGGEIPWKYATAKIIAAGLDWIDPGHCMKAYKNGT